jgi:anti-sigma factor RsiW
MTCPRIVALGAYVLGALEREERSRLEAHLETCAVCREELEELAPLPGLLSRLTVDEATVLDAEEGSRAEARAAVGEASRTEASSATPLERALFAVARERRR